MTAKSGGYRSSLGRRVGVEERHFVTFSLNAACEVPCLCYSLIPVWIWLNQEFMAGLLCVFRFVRVSSV